MEKIIIDTHSHVGKDIFHGDSELPGYIEYAKMNGVTAGLIMTVPSPCLDLNNPQSRYMYWKLINGQMNYFGNKNPFQQVNYNLFEQLMEVNEKQLSLFSIPVLHPIMDNISYIEEMYEKTKPVAMKIHGIGSGVGPTDISETLIKFLQNNNIPLIVHTDCDNGIGSVSMQYVRNKNTGYDWSIFFIKHGLKGILNHGASLDRRVFDLVNKSELLKVAIGPDLVACVDHNRLFTECHGDSKKYYQTLKDFVDPKKLLFDIDYNWNRTSSEDDDYTIVDRVVEMWGEDSQKVLGENALDFIPQITEELVKKKVLTRGK